MKPEELTRLYKDILVFSIQELNVPLTKFYTVKNFYNGGDKVYVSQSILYILDKLASQSGRRPDLVVLDISETKAEAKIASANPVQMAEIVLQLGWRYECVVYSDGILLKRS